MRGSDGIFADHRHGYFVRIPARAWYTWGGELLEDKGVVPDYVVANGHQQATDDQLDQAVDVVRGL